MGQFKSLSVGQHQLIGDIIGHSFADDPINRWVFGNRLSMTGYYTLVAKKLYLPYGFGHVMVDENCGTLWLPPTVKKDIPLWNSMDIAASMIRHSGFGSIIRGMSLDTTLAKKKPAGPHYYLFAIGTRPAEQGKGLGTALMQAGLEQVDQASLPAYLESSKESNIPFYNRFGFVVTEEIIPAKGSPPMWLMRREAQ